MLMGLIAKFWQALMWTVGLTPILKSFIGIFSYATVYIFHSFVKSSPGRAAVAMKNIIQNYFELQAPWAQLVAEYTNMLTGGRLNAEDFIGKSVVDISSAARMEFTRAFFNDILQAILPKPSELERNPFLGAERYLNANMKMQLDAWWLHVLGDFMSFGVFKSLKDLPNAISWSLGLGWLSWLVMGTPFRYACNIPVERAMNRVYTPEEHTVPQIWELFRTGRISWEQCQVRLLELGYHPDRIQEMAYLFHKEMPTSYAEDMMELGWLNPDDLKQHFVRQGYDPATAETMTAVTQKKRTLKLRNKIIQEAGNLFLYGGLSESEMKYILQSSGYNEDEIQYYMTALNLEKQRRSQLSDSDIAKAVSENLIGWNTAISKLRSRGYSPEDAELYLKLRVPKEKWF